VKRRASPGNLNHMVLTGIRGRVEQWGGVEGGGGGGGGGGWGGLGGGGGGGGGGVG